MGCNALARESLLTADFHRLGSQAGLDRKLQSAENFFIIWLDLVSILVATFFSETPLRPRTGIFMMSK